MRYDPETETILPVAFDTTQITSPSNYSNPKPGDPCHPLAAGAHPPAVAFQQNTRDEVRYIGGDGQIAGALAAEAGMKQQNYIFQPPAVAYETLTHQGLNVDFPYASTQKRNTGKVLLKLRDEIGAQAFAEWGLGILDSLQSEKVLRKVVHGKGVRLPSFSRSWVVYCSLSREEGRSKGAMQSVREAAREGCPSQRWEPPQQLSRELGAYLSELSQSGSQAERFMLDLWEAEQRDGVLRHTLSAIQEMGRPASSKNKPAHSYKEVRTKSQVRRLVCEECEILQGFPRHHTLIPWRNKPADQCPDGPRYKALGNSMAVPVMRWIGERIHKAHQEYLLNIL